MIVGKSFEGDNTKLGWLQHDVYHQALGIILEGCRGHLECSCVMLGVPLRGFWPLDRSTDHRMIQRAHDLLAAAWRHQVCPTAPDLYDSPQAHPVSVDEWLPWLRAEVASWHGEPDIVACIRTIVINQSADSGYQAEDDLDQLLLARFQHVPWTVLSLSASRGVI